MNRRGVSGALVIVAVARTRRRVIQPSEIVDAEHPDREGIRADAEIDPDDTEAVAYTALLDAEEDAIRSALRIVRERLREREARPRQQVSP